MNKNIIRAILLAAISILFVCCKSDKDKEIFNGTIRYIDDSRKVVKKVTSQSVSLEGLHTGIIAAYDSLLICWSPDYPNHFFNITNLGTGKEIGFFCEKGQGPREAISANCIFQLFKKENDLCTYLWSYADGRLSLWNISQSIRTGTTVYDEIVSYDKNRYFSLFYQPGDTLFVNRPSDFLNVEEVTTPFYEKRTIHSKEVVQDYPIYRKPLLRNKDAAQLELSLKTWDAIKPDGSKIAQAMMYLPQINILDTRTGNLAGYRMKNSPDLSFLEEADKDIKLMNRYYNSIHADNQYIYASYWGKEQWSDRRGEETPLFNTIHVFDWNGKLLYELITDRSFFHVWVDQVRNRLYTTDINTDEVYYVDLRELNL